MKAKYFVISESQYIKLVSLLKEDTQVDVKDLEIQQTLNRSIFDENDQMLPNVRKSLLQAAKDYYEFLQIEDVKIIDIILAGSMANYNWSDYSDVDVHLVIKFSEIGEDKDIIGNMMWALKEKWNLDHNIKIGKYKVELYTENIEDSDLQSNGIFSIVKNKWLKYPKKVKITINTNAIQEIVNDYNSKLDRLILIVEKGGTCEGLVEQFDDLLEELYDMRKEALAENGEFATENLAFKVLRRDKFIEKLIDYKNKVYDFTLSVNPEMGLQDKEEKIKDKKIAIAKGNQVTADSKSDGEVKDYQYKINGKKYDSLRIAAKELGIPHTTIQYRVNSDNPQWAAYQKL